MEVLENNHYDEHKPNINWINEDEKYDYDLQEDYYKFVTQAMFEDKTLSGHFVYEETTFSRQQFRFYI